MESYIQYVDRRTGEVVEKVTRDHIRHLSVQMVNMDPSAVVDTDQVGADINYVIQRFHRTGQLPVAEKEPRYGDVTGFQGDLTERWLESQETLDTAENFAQSYEPSSEDKSGEPGNTATAPDQPQAPKKDTAESSEE